MKKQEAYVEIEGYLKRVLSFNRKGVLILKDGQEVQVPIKVARIFTMTYFLN